MGAFNTEIAKYANNLLHNPNSIEILESFDTKFQNGLFHQDDKGNSIMHYLAAKNAFNAFASVINFILNKPTFSDIDIQNLINIPNHKGMSVAHIICAFDAIDLVEYLVKFNANLFLENLDGQRPLEIAAQQNRVNVLSKFHEFYHNNQLNPLLVIYRGKNLLQIAIESDSFDSFSFLIKQKDLNCLQHVDYLRNTPLHIAANMENIQYIKEILEHKIINLNCHNGAGCTATEIAYNNNNFDIVVELILNEASIDQKMAENIGYKTVENMTSTIVSSVLDQYGTFVGISKSESNIQKLKKKITNFSSHLQMISLSKLNPKIHNLIDTLISKLQKVSGKKITRNLDEIKKILSPILNEFIKEVSHA